MSTVGCSKLDRLQSLSGRVAEEEKLDFWCKGKGRAKLSLRLSKYHAMKMYPVLHKTPHYKDVYLHTLLNPPLNGGE